MLLLQGRSVLFFRTLAVNAVFSWVFNEFEEKSPAAFSSFYEQLLQLFDRYNHDLTGRLRIVSNLEYIEKVVKPTLDAKAIHYQQKLYNILSSLQMKPASQVWISQGDGQDNEKRRDFEYRSRQLLQWETAIHLAFHKALNVRLQMARSSRFYQARIFTMGDNFDPKWMEPVSSSDRDTESQRQVYLCVLPAICSYSRPPDLEDPVVVSKAQVILEINGTNAARGGADERDRSPDL